MRTARRAAAWVSLFDHYRDLAHEYSNGRRTSVFVSYRRHNGAFTNNFGRSVEARMEKASKDAVSHEFRLWMDVKVKPGERWSEGILAALAVSNATISMETPEYIDDSAAKKKLPAYEQSKYCMIEKAIAELRADRPESTYKFLPIKFGAQAASEPRISVTINTEMSEIRKLSLDSLEQFPDIANAIISVADELSRHKEEVRMMVARPNP
jgi:hypothetical protein